MSLELILSITLTCVLSLSLMHSLEEQKYNLVFGYWLVVDLAWRLALGGKRRLRYLLEANEVEEKT